MPQTYHLRQANTCHPPTKRQREKLQSYITALPTATPAADGSLSIGWARLTWAPDGLTLDVNEQGDSPPTDLTHLIWHALDLGFGISVGAPEDLDDWETDAIEMVFGFRPAKSAPAGPQPAPEPIERLKRPVIPLVFPSPLGFAFFGPNWEESHAREVALHAFDGHLLGPFTLWVARQPDLLLITPCELTEALVEWLSLCPQEPTPLPEGARPILCRRPDGSFVRLWTEVPSGRKAVQSIKYEWGKWRWENRPYTLIDG